MLNHSPKQRPSAVEARKKYKEFVEELPSHIDEDYFTTLLFDRILAIGSKPTMGRTRFVRRRRLSRHRNVKYLYDI